MPCEGGAPNMSKAEEFLRKYGVKLELQTDCITNEMNLLRRKTGVYLFICTLTFKNKTEGHCGVYCAEESWTCDEQTGCGVLKDNQGPPTRVEDTDRVSQETARTLFAPLWNVDKAKLENAYRLVPAST